MLKGLPALDFKPPDDDGDDDTKQDSLAGAATDARCDTRRGAARDRITVIRESGVFLKEPCMHAPADKSDY